MKEQPKLSQLELLKEFFLNNSNRDINHPEVVDWSVSEWKKRTGKIFRDPDRGIRSLYEQGFLVKVKKGVYRCTPEKIKQKKKLDFTKKQKLEILKRDKYRCVICGLGKKEGLELHVDHIKPKDLGGEAEITNGQTLCSIHNFRKKNYQQTETGKKMFIRLYEKAKSLKDEDTVKFCQEVLDVFEKNNVNGHIVWKK